MLIYVDDTTVANSSSRAIEGLLRQLREEFAVKGLGYLHYFLGIEVLKACGGGLVLTQRKHVVEILRRAGMEKCKPTTTPMSSLEKLSKQDGELLSISEGL